MKINATRRAVALILAVLMLLSVAVVIWDVTVNAAVENYARGKTYTSSAASFLSGKDDSGSLLTDGVVGTDEANGVTVAYAGSKKTYTLVFDLGEVKYDIKTIKFMNVFVSGNRGFGSDEVKISIAKTPESLGGYENTYTYESVAQHGTNYFNYVYDLSTEAVGRYVSISMYSPEYVLSLSEIEIWGNGNPKVDDDEPTLVNYALNNPYIAPVASYNSSFEDSGSLLTDGVVALQETPGATVAYIGTDKSYTIIFDLGSSKDDIKTIKIRNVYINSNRSFSGDRVVIGAAESMDSAEPVTYSYTYEKEAQSGSTYFDFVYTLDSEAVGRYVYVTIHTPLYVLSLSEVEIWSAPQMSSSIVIPDPIDPEPKFDIVLSGASEFKKDNTFELLCTVKNISATYGIVAVDFVVNYNTAAFTPVYPSGSDLSANYIKTAPMDGSNLLWEDIGTYCDTAKGVVYMRFAHKEAENGDGTKKDGELVFKILFKAKVSSGTYNFEATSCRGTDPGSSNYKKLTEVNANGSEFSTTAKIASAGLVPVANGISVSNGYVYGIAPGKTASDIGAMFEGSVAVAKNGKSETSATGFTVTSEDGSETAVIVVFGDVDGTGSVDTTDYLSIKKHFLGHITLEGMYAAAADTDRSGNIDSTDYMKVKTHFLGMTSLF